MATKKKMVPVTSVTPTSKVKAVSKAQQARTRNLVMGIASVTPVGRAAKVAGKTASKVIGNAINKKTRTNYLDGLYYTSGLEPGIKAARNARKVANSFEKPIKAKAKANARGLRAANKPTNKVGSKADKELRSRTKSVTLGKEETATLNDYYYGQPDMVQVMSRRTPVNEARSVNKFRPTPKKKTAAELRPKKK